VNPIAWLLWHAARVEDVGVNRFITDGRQVLDTGAWLGFGDEPYVSLHLLGAGESTT